MCGRFALKTKPAKIAKKFNAAILETFNEHYNIAPSARIPVLQYDTEKKERIIKRDIWGLIPYWAKNPKIQYMTSNARADTITEKASYKYAFIKRRCLVVMDGFYEWNRSVEPPQPYYFSMKDDDPFVCAGLFESWKVRWEEDPRDLLKFEKAGKKPNPVTWPIKLGGKEFKEGNALDSCTIITTDPNELMAKIHDRLPVILDPKDYDTWLDPKVQDAEILKPLLKPYPAEKMQCWPVDRTVNKVGVDDTENCIKEVKAQS